MLEEFIRRGQAAQQAVDQILAISEVPASACPNCGCEMDHAGALLKPDATAGPGDVTICIKCANVNVFTEIMQLREMTADEIAQLPAGMRRHIKTIASFIRQIRREKSDA